MTEISTSHFFGVEAKRARPTLNHRLAIVPGILGTFYAVNEELEARYFDYSLTKALSFAGISGTEESIVELDLRVSQPTGNFRYIKYGCQEANPKPNEYCLWILKTPPPKPQSPRIWLDPQGEPWIEYPPGSNQVVWIDRQVLRLVAEKFGTCDINTVGVPLHAAKPGKQYYK